MTTRFGLSGVALGVVAGLGVGLAGVVGWQYLRPSSPPEPPHAQPAAIAPPGGVAATPPARSTTAVQSVDAAQAERPVTQPEQDAQAPSAALEAPRFDTFHVSDDGAAIVAGIARGASAVAVLVDSAEVSRSTPERNGRFAALFTLAPSTEARMLSLRAYGAEGREVTSEESILIAPVAATTDVAETQPSATPPSEGPGGAEKTAEGVVELSAQPQSATISAQTAATPEAPVLAQPFEGDTTAAVAPVALLLTEDGARKLDAPADGTLTIDAITYAASGAVSVAGRGRAGLGLRLYLDDAPKLDALVDAQGRWQGELQAVAPGLYRLRADQLDAAGKVVARSETPFLREGPEALAAATPLSGAGQAPAAQLVTVQPGFTLWGIAKSTYGDGLRYVQVFDANRSQIRNPDLIYPGQVFSLPQPQ